MLNNVKELNTSRLANVVDLASITLDKAINLTDDKNIFRRPKDANELADFNQRIDQIVTASLRKKFNV